MKHWWLLLGGLTLFMAAGVLSAPWLVGDRELGKLKQLDSFPTLPENHRVLRKPTEEQLREIFPADSQAVLENAEKLILLALDPGDGAYPAPAPHKSFATGKLSAASS